MGAMSIVAQQSEEGAMSITALQPDEGLELVIESSDRTWLEVVKAACSAEGRDIASLDSSHYPVVVDQSWIHNSKDTKDSSKDSNTDHFVDGVLKRVNTSFDEYTKAYKTVGEEERELVRLLLEKMDSGELTETFFIGVLKPYLVLLKYKAIGGNTSIASDEPHREFTPQSSPSTSSRTDRRSAMIVLERVAGHLGPVLVAVVLDCCIMLRLWSMAHVLLEKRVVDTRGCSKIIESAIENQQPRTLCVCITHAVDLAPRDVHSILEFLVNSVENTSKSFLVVKGEWRRVALQKINAFRSKVITTSEGEHQRSSETVLALAKAIDAFSAPELCLHHLVASDQDESVLSSVVGRLEEHQLLRLLQYLSKWVDLYSSQLGRYPNPKIPRIPSLNQVIIWTNVILEVNYTRFVFSSDFHPVVKALKKIVQPLVDLSIHLTPLIGIVDHCIHQRNHTKPRVEVLAASTDYVIELLDLG